MAVETLQFNNSNTKLSLPADKVEWDSLLKYRFFPDVASTIPEESEQAGLPKLEETISSTELDFEERKLLRYLVYDLYDFYFLDYSVPAEINNDAIASRFGDLKVDYIRKTRLALALSMAGLSATMIAGLLMLPHPYNLASLALCGPLFVSTYGLITQNN